MTLYVPRPKEAADPQADVSARERQVRPGLRVLLVEDDPEVRAIVRRFLVSMQCDIATVASGEQALLALGPEARFDLLLSDIALGAGIRGTELAAQAQRRFPEMAVLLMSGYSAELLDADRDSPPAWELLRKPCTREELAQAVARAVGDD